MRDTLVSLICDRLESELEAFKNRFRNSAKGVTCRYLAIDNLLPKNIAHEIAEKFPEPQKMRLMTSFREKKFTSKQLQEFDPIISDITFAFQDPRVIALVEKITGMRKQLPDPHLYAGGLSAMSQGHFLNPHIDNSHDSKREHYRTLNLLYYISPDWKDEDGGHLELWDKKVKCPLVIHSFFNRLVLMETHKTSWHSVCTVKRDGVRRCVSNYYFSENSPDGSDYFHITAFSARPEQKVRRVIARLDNIARTAVRKIVKYGLGKRDLFIARTQRDL